MGRESDYSGLARILMRMRFTPVFQASVGIERVATDYTTIFAGKPGYAPLVHLSFSAPVLS